MLLRRVIKHVSDQNWIAVVVDFLIVVAGIFVGLQVQQWSAGQAEIKQERLYLERILVDVNFSLEANKSTLDYNVAPIESIWEVYQSLNSCQLVAESERDRFANGMFYIGRFIGTTFDMGTVNEMKSAGNFALIRNSKIRDLLNKIASHRELDQVLLPTISRRVGPSMAYIDQRISVNKRDLGPFSTVTWSELVIDFDELCEDTKFLGALTVIRSIRQVYVRTNKRTIQVLEATKQALLEELGRSSVEN